MSDYLRQIAQSSIEQAIKTAAVSSSAPIIAAYLFGSRVTGRVWAGSDVDVALLFGELGASNQLKIANRFGEDLRQSLGNVEIDIVSLDQVSTDFAYEILRTGQLTFCANHEARIQFEMKVHKEYADEEPWREIGRRYLMQRVKTRQMLKKGKDMINRRHVENLSNFQY